MGFSTHALLALSLSGIMHFVWGRYCNYRATRAIGTNLVAPIQQINLIFTLLLAIWILGETLTPLRILGIALVLLGPSFTLREGRAPATARCRGHRDGSRPVTSWRDPPRPGCGQASGVPATIWRKDISGRCCPPPATG